MNFNEFESLRMQLRPNGVLLMTMQTGQKKNAMTAQLHRELARVWASIGHDPQINVVVVTGSGDAFSAGGELSWVKALIEKPGTQEGRRDFSDFDELLAIPDGMLNLNKPIIAAVNGAAVAGGLAVALMADISIVAEDAVICDGHVRGGLVAGDHAAMIWPLLCGMAKSKYYLLTGRALDGAEAARIGLVSQAVRKEDVLSTALQIADELATGPQLAIRWTKRALNGWLRQALPIFEHSAALERLSFIHPDALEAVAALIERRKPSFTSNRSSRG
jgi:enoyl-CoA hydratase/carnithine racemase